jgi:hypothetical protein
MGRLKIKDIEGEASDVNNLFQSGVCNWASYLGVEPPQKTFPTIWIWIMAIIFFVLASCVWIGVFNVACMKVAVLGLFLLCFSILWAVHYNHKNWSLTVITGVAGLVLILVALNVYTPQEIAKKLEKTVTNKVEEKQK